MKNDGRAFGFILEQEDLARNECFLVFTLSNFPGFSSALAFVSKIYLSFSNMMARKSKGRDWVSKLRFC